MESLRQFSVHHESIKANVLYTPVARQVTGVARAGTLTEVFLGSR